MECRVSNIQYNAGAQNDRGRSEQKRRTILQSAEELFLTRGFDGTSMDEVAVHAGVSKQTVYNQFANTQFNWLVMGEPVNQAMFNADYLRIPGIS